MDGDRGPNGSVDPRYCSSCGTALEPAANYCPDCGAATGRWNVDSSRPLDDRPRSKTAPTSNSPSADRVRSRRATDRPPLEYRIAAATKDGWRLEHDFGDHVVMVRRTVGSVADHLLVALITAWWTMGLGNVIYGVYRYGNDAERMVLSADERMAANPLRRSLLFRWAIAAVCWLSAAILLATAVQLSTGAMLLVGAIAVFVGLVGTTLLPSVRRRLENRHSIRATGRVRTVDERSVRSPDEPCTACASSIEDGIERTYRTDYCVFGIPVNSSADHNHYCRVCANAERDPVDPIGSLETGRPSGRRGRDAVREPQPSDSDGEPDLDRR
ncbi:zinc ribbon domain-containing protein [Salinadaptatus halalkaliphilus]|uniref:Zinc ribbon domain-containing protein n=1 Tax=Salinadaptatus halalkaliphilus TaxID=2419781 RepID=A0A4S3TI24_9EURY|nr:zinc ribbon domain-containing protein [Salinadaptatus halalkaliphilus]THE63694.1 zinc ribbon domain-containing protein [Salinadaptatus halalkaliphilus]